MKQKRELLFKGPLILSGNKMAEHKKGCPRLQFWDAGEHESPCNRGGKPRPRKPKPCPFCGEGKNLDPGYYHDGSFVVMCIRCGAEGPWILGQTEKHGITQWNTRKGE